MIIKETTGLCLKEKTELRRERSINRMGIDRNTLYGQNIGTISMSVL